MKRSSLVSIVMFISLTIGYAAIHITLFMWVAAVWIATWGNTDPYEYLQFTEAGEAVITTQIPRQIATYRHLDGTPVPAGEIPSWQSKNPRLQIIGGNYHYGHYAAEGADTDDGPLFWSTRIEAFQDLQTPATFWYLINPPHRKGTSYFEGYSTSGRRVGYLGIDGFSANCPDIEHSFRMGGPSGFKLTSTQGNWYPAVEPHQPRIDLNGEYRSVHDAVWMVSDNTIYEIHLGNLSVRPLKKIEQEIRALAHAGIKRDDKYHLQLLVRTLDGLLIVDHETDARKFIKLEPVGPLTRETFYLLSDGRAILDRVTSSDIQPETQTTHEITWLDTEGKVEHQAEATVHHSRVTEGQVMPWSCPAPIVPYGLFLMAPWLNGSPASATAGEKYAAFLSREFAPLLFATIVGVAAAWGCRRREREVFGRTGWLWPIMVGLCGWFGWMGYICLNPLPARLPNRRWMPAQPEPNVPLGTEIFA